MQLTRTHYFVLFCAVDWDNIAALLTGSNVMIGSGEEFTLVPPTPPDDARRATLELLEVGALELSRFDSAAGRGRDYDGDEARAVLADLATWDLDADPGAHAYEIGLTKRGRALYEEAYRLYGRETERALEQARERNGEFMRRHPDYIEKNRRYLKALDRWMTWGGPEPEPPRFD